MTIEALPAASKRWLAVAAVLGFLAVLFGAFAAHGLESALADRSVDVPKAIANVKTGAEYQMSHALAIGLIAVLLQSGRSALLSVAAWCLLVGVALFSGSLYLLETSVLFAGGRIRLLGAITPIGGTLFLVGWGALAFAAMTGFNRPPSNVRID